MLRLTELLSAKAVKQKDLASAIGVSESTVSLYVKGKRQPDIDTLSAIAKYLDVPLGYLCGDDSSCLNEKTAQSKLDGQVVEVTRLCAQLTPENLEKARSYLQYLLEREQSADQSLPADHPD